MIRQLRNYFVTGILVLTPIVLTIYIFWKIFRGLDNIIFDVINGLLAIAGLPLYHGKIPGLGVVVGLLAIVLAGMIAQNYIGHKLFKLGDSLVTRIPLFSKIYTAIRQVFEAIFSERREVFKQAVLFEFPRHGVYSIGFITQHTRGEIPQRLAKEVLSVYLPTSPVPTAGFLLFVPKADLIFLDMPVEDALKLVISGGAILADANLSQDIASEKIKPQPEEK